MKSKASSWKQKIDPAFDKFIKSFLSLLESWGLPASEGYIDITESDHFKEIENNGFPSFISFYESRDLEGVLHIVSQYSKDSRPFDVIVNIFNKVELHEYNTDISSLLESLTDKLDMASRNYYRKWNTIPNPDKDLKKHLHFISDMISLQNHLMIVGNDLGKGQSTKLNANMLQWAIFTVWSALAFTLYKKSLSELYKEAQKGSDNSLFKLIKLDKTFVDHEWVRIRIRKAAYSGDKQFFDLLAKAIKDDTLKHRKVKLERHLILMNFWFYGLYRLTIPELMQLLEDSGIHIPEDAVTFRKFIDREIKPYYRGLY